MEQPGAESYAVARYMLTREELCKLASMLADAGPQDLRYSPMAGGVAGMPQWSLHTAQRS